jgi:hypothetical protein
MPDSTSSGEDERAPVFSNWNYWYVLVIAVLLILIGFFYFLTKKFS